MNTTHTHHPRTTKEINEHPVNMQLADESTATTCTVTVINILYAVQGKHAHIDKINITQPIGEWIGKVHAACPDLRAFLFDPTTVQNLSGTITILRVASQTARYSRETSPFMHNICLTLGPRSTTLRIPWYTLANRRAWPRVQQLARRRSSELRPVPYGTGTVRAPSKSIERWTTVIVTLFS